jgi:hypothetical protein
MPHCVNQLNTPFLIIIALKVLLRKHDSIKHAKPQPVLTGLELTSSIILQTDHLIFFVEDLRLPPRPVARSPSPSRVCDGA